MNQPNLYQEDRIRSYISGKMTPEERISFREDLVKDPKLAEAHRFLEALHLTLVFQEDKKKIEDANPVPNEGKVTQPNWRRVWMGAGAIAAAIILLAFVIVPILFPSSPYDTLPPSSYLAASHPQGEPISTSWVAKAIEQKNYIGIIDSLKSLSLSPETDPNWALGLALAYLYAPESQKDLDQTTQLLEWLVTEGYRNYSDANTRQSAKCKFQILLSQVAFESGRVEEAKSILQSLNEGSCEDPFFLDKAQTILSNL